MNPISYALRHPMNRGGGLAAIGRVLRWQIASRLLAGPIAFPFAENTFLFATRGMAGATGNWYCGLHEHEEMGFLLHFLRAEDTFLDVGANIGSYSILAAGAVGASVVSVEPIPETVRHLERNVLLNDLSSSVDVHRIGLSSANSELRFTSNLDTVNHVATDSVESDDIIQVPVTRMDALLMKYSTPALIKIDVEGHEGAVLIGGENTLADRRVAAVIMEVNGSGERYGVSDDVLLSMMRAHGFNIHGYDPFNRVLRDWDPAKGNAIFVRDLDLVLDRLKSARSYRLVNGSI